ncbi:DUF72 domain-containing protein [Sphingobacterium sp. UT-1RO-CII-1]|uniref:DUF72 domain-containing protein n=1 Tax=Sphingobacterium sp. UT-1RO-CII-1 TaxID=2995225 RepID=UPI00227A8A47|nr:DUF72 domain-containing protein [Sphingobacterium sp. UT-1RO-CII-1]MCY4779216.1 DUF72 domain-containing protein [Sphingobacterium sp. UT-1RO-CII-1]
MKFGQVDNPEGIDFSLPRTAQETIDLLNEHKNSNPLEVYVGCAKWNRADLKGFYPRGTKDELSYYSRQFNSIELNATFYNSPSKEQIITWKDKTPANFKFFPKLPQSISHYSRLLNCDEKVATFVDSTVLFEDKLGMAFLQMHDNYKPKDFDRLATFLENFPKGYPLALEVRNKEWFSNPEIARALYKTMHQNFITNILVDTAGRRDMLHMHLTTPVAFIRYVGANHPTDYDRLLDWVKTIKIWKEAGLQKLYFFIHQNIELESPLLATHFIKELNKEIGTDLQLPKSGNPTLF